ncbi:MAG TPA: FLgD tudor-like domain-containing protein [Gammaproteobacteria bacterium]
MSVSLRSNQALQASTLVGRSVYVPSSHMVFTNNETVSVLLCLQADSPNVEIVLENESGEIVFRKQMGEFTAGDIPLEFDPLDGDEVNLGNGQYLLRAEAEIDQQLQLVPTYIKAFVESVRLSDKQQEPLLNLRNKKTVELSKVRIIL